MSEAFEKTSPLEAATLEWIDRFAPYGVIATDRDFRVRGWNHWMGTHSGIPEKNALGKKLIELFPDLEKRRLVPQFERALSGEVSVVSTALHGYLFPFPPITREVGFQFMKQTARIAPLITQDQIHGVIIVIEDVTQREWQSEILRRQHARDEILAWALAHLMKAEDPTRVTREVFCKVAEHLDFDAYLFQIFEPESSTFKLHASGGIEPEQEEIIRVVPTRDIPWISDAKEGQAFVRENVQSSNDPLFAIAKRFGFRAYIVLPIVAGANLLAVFCFATRTRDSISATETELLTTIGQYLAVAFNREKSDRELRAAQKKLNEHAEELEQNVADRTASLKQIIAELQTFSYTIAHDLRAPIRALKGYCDILTEDYAASLPDEVKGILSRLRNASTQMDVLTRDLLEFSKVSRQEFNLSPIDLTQIVTDVTHVRGPALVGCAIQVPLHRVMANRVLATQCVSNLLDNALKFRKPGVALSLKIWSEVIAPHEQHTPGETSHFGRSRYSPAKIASPSEIASTSRFVRLWFEDNGLGISSEAQRKIFGIFERGDRASEFEGTGIGLAIVARAMERMGGECGVESEPGKGSRFWLEFHSAESDESASSHVSETR